MADPHGTDWFAWFVTAAFVGVIVLLAVVGLNATGSEAVLILVGTLSGGFSSVISFKYGSTVGSEKKSEQITQLAQTAATTASTAAAVQAATVAPPIVPDPVRVEMVGEGNPTAREGEEKAP